jgi:hypothetical protein
MAIRQIFSGSHCNSISKRDFPQVICATVSIESDFTGAASAIFLFFRALFECATFHRASFSYNSLPMITPTYKSILSHFFVQSSRMAQIFDRSIRKTPEALSIFAHSNPASRSEFRPNATLDQRGHFRRPKFPSSPRAGPAVL